MSEKLKEVLNALNGATTDDGLTLRAEVIDEESAMIQVVVDGREEFPIIVDIDEDQILALVSLWNETDVREGVEAEMMSAMLAMNIPLPLSAFGKTGSTYQLFGAMAPDTIASNLVLEVDLLSDNALAVYEAFEEYLKPASSS